MQVLALELLKVLLENSGRVFASSEKFADGIKHYLCLSLLKNCASANPHALRLSCSIFLTLISKFRHSLKAEVLAASLCTSVCTLKFNRTVTSMQQYSSHMHFKRRLKSELDQTRGC